MTFLRRVHGPALLDFLEFNRMRNQMEHAWKALRGGVDRIRDSYSAGVFPLINVTEDDESLTLVAELPGVRVEDLDLSIKSDTLTLKGEKKIPERPKEANFFRKERVEGTFSRSLTLPVRIDPEKSSASLRNGILTVQLPKSAESRAHQVSVKTE
ncbi:MAG: Hsp20/alpha crystallin family protein [Deltaproteobacteria bacterium]|jgi:HSP20 family protein|nr:Hsp20/alpha crystallin family protein [Deltaproteobacteria bacterium]